MMDVKNHQREEAGVLRGAAAAGFSITLSLAAVSAFAGAAFAAPAAVSAPAAKVGPVAVTSGHPSGGHSPSGSSGSSGSTGSTGSSKSSGSGGSSGGGGGGVTSGPLPNPVQNSQCDPTLPSPPSGTPWAQQALDYQSVSNFTQGAGIKVAVIDSGVDASPQLNGRVLVGQSFVSASSGPANGDCVGHGTLVAGIIGAAPVAGTRFAGVAPQATILSFKVSGQSTGDEGVHTINLAEAIDQAVQAGAKVINVSIASTQNDPVLESAVENAVHRNVVVVASAGNVQVNNAGQTIKKGPYYPADYPGVLSVGAVDQNGNLAYFSDTHTNVSVTAPGAVITSTAPGTTGDSYAVDQGTSFAAPFVSGLAALVWSRYPAMKAAQVVQRIEETADGAAGLGTGNGLINPVQAITAVEPARAASAQATARPGAVAVDRAPKNTSEKVVVLSLAGGGLVIAIAVIAAAVVIPAGRRRRWQPGGPA